MGAMDRFLMGLLLVFGTVSLAQPYKDSPAQKLFEEVSTLLETQYFGVKPIDWQLLFERYQTQVNAACASQKEQCAYTAIEPLLAKMFADLGDGHAFYLSAASVQSMSQLNQGNLASSTPRLGYTATRFCDTPTGECGTDPSGQVTQRQLPDQFVQHVVAGSPAAKSGLRYGDRILGYNSVLYSRANSNSELAQMASDFAKQVQGGEPITLRVQRGANREVLELTIIPAIIQEAEVPQLEIRDDKVAILTIKTFFIRGIAERVHQLLKSAMDQNVRGLIINLRGTSGGFATESLAIIAAFVEQPEALRYVPRYNADQNRIELNYQDGQVAILVNGTVAESLRVNNPVRFKAPVAVLVDNMCASACEYLPLYLQRNHRATVYGIPTNGLANTNTQQVPLQNGAVASIPVLQTYWVKDMVRLPERALPDTVTANFYFEHFVTGRDLPLEKAVKGLG